LTASGPAVLSGPALKPGLSLKQGQASRAPWRRVAVHASPAVQQYGLVTLTTWLLEEEKAGRTDMDMFALMTSIATACKQISSLVNRAAVANLMGAADAQNASGDEQKKLDVVANELFCAAVANCGRTSITVSEEEEKPVALEAVSGGAYIACFDPIDGSSNLDACISSGSIFGIYTPGECVIEEGDSPETMVDKCLVNVRKPGTDLVAAGYCMYSSHTILVLTLGHGVFGFTLDTTCGEFVLTHRNIRIPDPGQRIYSGNEGNTALWAPELREYLAELKRPSDGSPPYAYRYIGALCPDFHRILLYGGIWVYPPDIKAPQGKARLLYEVAPMSYLAEQAGGVACVGPLADQRVLEVVPEKVHQKSPLFVGSTTEMRKLQAFLRERAEAKAVVAA